jgi:hypothetical protein
VGNFTYHAFPPTLEAFCWRSIRTKQRLILQQAQKRRCGQDVDEEPRSQWLGWQWFYGLIETCCKIMDVRLKNRNCMIRSKPHHNTGPRKFLCILKSAKQLILIFYIKTPRNKQQHSSIHQHGQQNIKKEGRTRQWGRIWGAMETRGCQEKS